MLYAGLRKNEALRLKWEDLKDAEGIPCLTIGDTKNKRPHYVPITGQIQKILDKAQNGSVWVVPSTQRPDSCIKDVRPTLRRLTKLIDFEFKCHDLRRTFATRAAEVGIDYLMIKRMLTIRPMISLGSTFSGTPGRICWLCEPRLRGLATDQKSAEL